jgi:hypothetical protein
MNITIDGIEYIPIEETTNENNYSYVIIRTYSAGVHAGYLSERKGKEVELINSRRLWYWDGAFTLSKLAVDGTAKPEECKFSCVVPKIKLTEAIEVIFCTKKAIESIQGVNEHVS